MAKERIIRIHDLLGALNGLYPPALAEDWDNVGLQVGDPGSEVRRVLVCLDVNEAAVQRAVAAGAQALIAHHPLLLKPLKRVSPGDEPGRSVFAAIRAEVAVLCAHTNLDRACPGLNDWLADRLGLNGTQPLLGGREGELLKLVVFIPDGHQDAVAEALFAAGAGRIGAYDCCSFRVFGEGSFRAGPDCTPFIGRPGERERTPEWRLEVAVPAELSGRVINRLLKAHPYEDVAYDLFPLRNRREDIGLGRIGRLSAEISLEAFARRVKDALALDHLRLVGDPRQPVEKVAVCGGSGAFLIHEAARRGADVLVTGDIKYHEARSAEQLGLGLLDAGHFGTEQLVVDDLRAALSAIAEQRQWPVEFVSMSGEKEPFQVI
ncbi:Nif3-like dinuclear metal center hexameric protein [Geothermobacter hydrogeniphilus]|uniref:GTP cyclohydrolase 1 type 2 homolog n=1 Tax=Geothermobacter hydrogeniphilus TaxID=1969733 RepID=A0A1X0XQ79_9BACT|nr:Nif3-like dinuclear metal center hexameric protein [Geothermobacter hydrogeniphilus]ORJ55033.1 Nif3-like dinuclear metal center hexameric protein [Geothermobacter hydrogeniphilus]